MHDRDEILRGYFQHLQNTHDEDLYELVEDVDELVHTDPVAAWDLIKALIHAASSDDELAYLSAGPLENLLVSHGGIVAGLIRQEALNNERVRDALARVLIHPAADVQRALGEWLLPIT